MSVTEQFVRGLPKAEVHVHLEGCFEPADLGAADGRTGQAAAGEPGAFADLGDFLHRLDAACAAVRTADQVAALSRRFARHEAEQGVRYADLLVSPVHWVAWHERLGGFVDAIDAGLREAAQDGAPPVGLCVSVSRHASAPAARQLVEELLELGSPRVVALAVDGDESVAGRTSARLAEAFELAARGGLRRTVHAGESSGPEGVLDAIRVLGAERIDHGVRAIEDPAVVGELADRGIPLGVCPHSNVLLGLYPTRAQHPVDALRRAGVRVSINTDDPITFGCRLTEEYVANAETFGWDATVVGQLARTSLEASFAPPETIASLAHDLDAYLRTTGSPT